MRMRIWGIIYARRKYAGERRGYCDSFFSFVNILDKSEDHVQLPLWMLRISQVLGFRLLQPEDLSVMFLPNPESSFAQHRQVCCPPQSLRCPCRRQDVHRKSTQDYGV